MPACPICFDDEIAADATVTCASCSNSFCRACIQEYTLSTGQQIKCPDTICAQPWSEEFVDQAVSTEFLHKELRAHREKVLVDAEKVRLPEFQEQARRYAIALAEKKKLEEAYVAATPNVALYRKWESLHMRTSNLETGLRNMQRGFWSSDPLTYIRPWTKEYTARFEEYKAEYDVKKPELDAIDEETAMKGKEELEAATKINIAPHIRKVLVSYGEPVEPPAKKWLPAGDALYGEGWRLTDGTAAPAAKPQPLRGCPVENCRGFLSTGGICGLCDAKICMCCHEVVGKKGEEVVQVGPTEEMTFTVGGRSHICNKDSVETAKMLAKETRSCPTCKACIYKTDGCDQMWCTQCKTAFSWRTGQVESGRVHNPHYYEWLRRTQGSVPREEGDVPAAAAGAGPEEVDCCRPEAELVDYPMSLFGYEDVAEEKRELAEDYMQELHRHVPHLMGYYYDLTPPAIGKYNVKYLAGEITESEWRRRIFLEKRTYQRKQTFHMIRTTLAATIRDVLNSYILARGTIKVGETIKQMTQLMTFACNAIEEYKKRFNYSGVDNAVRLLPEIYYGDVYEHINQERQRLSDMATPLYMMFANWLESS